MWIIAPRLDRLREAGILLRSLIKGVSEPQKKVGDWSGPDGHSIPDVPSSNPGPYKGKDPLSLTHKTCRLNYLILRSVRFSMRFALLSHQVMQRQKPAGCAIPFVLSICPESHSRFLRGI